MYSIDAWSLAVSQGLPWEQERRPRSPLKDWTVSGSGLPLLGAQSLRPGPALSSMEPNS